MTEQHPGPPTRAARQIKRLSRRNRGLTLLLWTLICVVLVAGTIVFFIFKDYDGEPQEVVTPAPVTVTIPAPTPAPEVTPIVTRPTSEFHDLLPDTVLQYVLKTTKPDQAAKGAIEAYNLTYTDGDGAKITVHATQWASEKEAEKQFSRQDKAAQKEHPDGQVSKDDVVVSDGEEVGGQSARLDDEDGVITWRNGTAVLQVVGPAQDIEDFFTAYPV